MATLCRWSNSHATESRQEIVANMNNQKIQSEKMILPLSQNNSPFSGINKIKDQESQQEFILTWIQPPAWNPDHSEQKRAAIAKLPGLIGTKENNQILQTILRPEVVEYREGDIRVK